MFKNQLNINYKITKAFSMKLLFILFFCSYLCDFGKSKAFLTQSCLQRMGVWTPPTGTKLDWGVLVSDHLGLNVAVRSGFMMCLMYHISSVQECLHSFARLEARSSLCLELSWMPFSMVLAGPSRILGDDLCWKLTDLVSICDAMIISYHIITQLPQFIAFL